MQIFCITLQCHGTIPLKFSGLNIIYFGQKEPIIVQFFRLLSTLMKVHPVPHTIFEINKAGSIQILHRCLVSSKIAPLQFFSSNYIYFVQKYPIKIQVFKLFTTHVKPHQITYLAFQIRSPFSFKVYTLQCDQISFLCSFVAESLHAIDKRSNGSAHFHNCHCFHQNSQNSWCHFWNQEPTFSSNVRSLFTVIRHNSSVLSHLNFYIIWTKRAQQSANFQIFECFHKTNQISMSNL